jgi:hypothetical protein
MKDEVKTKLASANDGSAYYAPASASMMNPFIVCCRAA